MTDMNSSILIVSVLFTVVLAVVSLITVIMMYKKITPYEFTREQKYGMIFAFVLLAILLLAHVIMALGDNAVGKDDWKILFPGIFAVVFAVTSGISVAFAKKYGERSLVFFTTSFALLWICVIVHVASRMII